MIGHSHKLFAPVSSETVAHPERGLPADTQTLVGGQPLKIMAVDAEYLAITGQKVGLTRAEAVEFAERLKGVRVPPSGIKHGR